MFDYIERFYNPFRNQSKLNCRSPIQFEQRKRLKGEATRPRNRGMPTTYLLRVRALGS